MSVNRCYSEKKPGFDVEARSLFSSLHDLLEIKNLTHVRYLCRYDAEGLSGETYEKAKGIVFSEPMADVCYDEDFPRSDDDEFNMRLHAPSGRRAYRPRGRAAARSVRPACGLLRPVHPAAHRRRTPDRRSSEDLCPRRRTDCRGHGQDPRLPHQPGRHP